MRSTLLDLNILIVDDNRHMLNLLRTTLRDLGVRTVKAFESVETAFHYCERARPDLILTDWEMEPVNGIEFVRMIRQHSDLELKRVPIVMVTGHADTERVLEARNAGVSEFLVKPITVRSITEKLASVVERPRYFIRTPDYSGPDRRRAKKTYAGHERRRPVEGIFPQGATAIGVGARQKVAVDQGTLPADVLGFLQTDNAATEMKFLALAERFSRELPRAVDDLRQECQIAVNDPANRKGHMGRVYKLSHDLKGQGGVFNYPLISETAALLCRFIDRAGMFGPAELAIVSAHLDTMYVVAKHAIKGDGGPTGKALIQKLATMVQNYEPAM